MKQEKKEKHPIYRLIMGMFVFLLAMGILILVLGILWGDDILLLRQMQSV